MAEVVEQYAEFAAAVHAAADGFADLTRAWPSTSSTWSAGRPELRGGCWPDAPDDTRVLDATADRLVELASEVMSFLD